MTKNVTPRKTATPVMMWMKCSISREMGVWPTSSPDARFAMRPITVRSPVKMTTPRAVPKTTVTSSTRPWSATWWHRSQEPNQMIPSEVTFPGKGAKYCDQRVCLFVCLFVCSATRYNRSQETMPLRKFVNVLHAFLISVFFLVPL